MCKKFTVVAALLLAALTGAPEAEAQEVLVFGSPGLRAGSNTVTKRFTDWGYTATIVDSAGWGALTTADFAQFDAIYTDGLCNSSMDWSTAMAANQDAMMAAVTGRVYLSVADPDAHTTAGGTAPADRATENALAWATGLGSTASGGATGLVFHSGCPEAGGIDIFGNFPSFGSITTVLTNIESSSILTPAHPTMTTPNALTAADFIWSFYCHGSISAAALPAGYTAAVNCTDGNIGVLTREALPRNVLVYGPSTGGGGAGGATTIITGLGHTLTVADATAWCGMTTDDFAAFDAIYFDGQWPVDMTEPTTCADLGGSGGTWADIVIETEPLWGPAITGRIYLTTADAAYHTGSATIDATIQNGITWATSGGATAAGGHTGLVMYTGGLETEASPAVFILDALSATLGAIVSNTSDTEANALLTPAHDANNIPNVLTISNYIWGNYCHGEMVSIPAGYEPLNDCLGGGFGTIVRDFAFCGNDVTESILGEECDGLDSPACPAGYSGTQLCNNDATTPGDGTCTLTGTGCTDIDECTLGTDNCDTNATCTNTDGSFTCACNAGYTGDGVTCTDIDECTLGTDNCTATADGGVCTNTDGSFACSCATGYAGDGVLVSDGGTGCTDIDECTAGTDDCTDAADGGVCTNEVGGFSCSCMTGYTGDGTVGGTGCVDDDECTLGTDDCDTNATCTNTGGGFDCTCNDGYSGDGHTGGTGCLDDNECSLGTDDCDDNADCTNTDGGFECTCADGFTGDGTTCTDVDECTDGTDTCDSNATCENTDGGYTCTCNDGFSGDGETCSEDDPGAPDAGTGDGSSDDGGCSCRVGGSNRSMPGAASGLLLLGLGLVVVRRRRRRR